MFKRFRIVLSDLVLSLSLIRSELYELRKDISNPLRFSNDYKYVVKLQTKESNLESKPLSSLKEVNEYINGLLFLSSIANIHIEKVYYDGR